MPSLQRSVNVMSRNDTSSMMAYASTLKIVRVQVHELRVVRAAIQVIRGHDVEDVDHRHDHFGVLDEHNKLDRKQQLRDFSDKLEPLLLALLVKVGNLAEAGKLCAGFLAKGLIDFLETKNRTALPLFLHTGRSDGC